VGVEVAVSGGAIVAVGTPVAGGKAVSVGRGLTEVAVPTGDDDRLQAVRTVTTVNARGKQSRRRFTLFPPRHA
jgi:hypothetical protein